MTTNKDNKVYDVLQNRPWFYNETSLTDWQQCIFNPAVSIRQYTA